MGYVIPSLTAQAGSLAVSQGVFPLSIAAGGRYLQQADGAPFPIFNRASWYVLGRSVAEYEAYIDDCAAKGFTAVEIKAMGHDTVHSQPYSPPFNGNHDLPFSTKVGGGTYTGLSDTPDFTDPNESYWTFVDGFIDYCASKGIAVLVFPAYFGYRDSGGGNISPSQGWLDEMVSNGTTRMQTYGAWIANRWKSKPNIIWMYGGDAGSPGQLSTGQEDVESSLIAGIESVSGQASTLTSAEWNATAIAAESGSSNWSSHITLNGVYTYFNLSFYCLQAYNDAFGPAWWLEGVYDNNGQTGLSTDPMRRWYIWAHLSTIGGASAGDTILWNFNNGYTSQFNSQYFADCGRYNAFIKALPWHRLIPESKGTYTSSIGTVVTSGAGSQDSQDGGTGGDMVTCAITSLGDCMVLYKGPEHTSSIGINCAKFRGTITFQWWDPTNNTYTAAGTHANSGTATLTHPGTNSRSQNDWVLLGTA